MSPKKHKNSLLIPFTVILAILAILTTTLFGIESINKSLILDYGNTADSMVMGSTFGYLIISIPIAFAIFYYRNSKTLKSSKRTLVRAAIVIGIILLSLILSLTQTSSDLHEYEQGYVAEILVEAWSGEDDPSKKSDLSNYYACIVNEIRHSSEGIRGWFKNAGVDLKEYISIIRGEKTASVNEVESINALIAKSAQGHSDKCTNML